MLKDFEKYLIEEKLADNTIASYINDVNIFLTFFKEHFGEEIIKLSHIEIAEYIKELKKVNTKATSINRKLAALSRYNMFLIKNNIQTEHVISKKDYIKIQSNMCAPYSPTAKDVFKIRLCAKDNKRDLAILTLLAYSGIRESELVHIELTDVNLQARTIIIKGKGNKVRTVLITDLIYDTLVDYIEERKAEGTYDKNKYLFIGRQGIENNKPLDRTTINSIIKKYAEKANIYMHPHLFRDFFCTEAHRTKALSIMQIAYLAGHSSINTTKKYIQIQENELFAQLNKV